MGAKLGQHFLTNKSVIPKIIAALDLQSGDTVIEIGPGEGALTFPLLEICKKIGAKLIAIEKDPELVSGIKYRVLSMDGEIIQGDALKILPEIHTKYLIPNTSYKVVGNIPYYITGQLLRILSESENPPKTSVLMVQKEVAERICSQPPKMNLLSAITQFWAHPELILRLKPKDFDPPPKVDSAVIKLTVKQLTKPTSEVGSPTVNVRVNDIKTDYFRLVKLIFKQPRKTAANNLADGLGIPKKEAVELVKSLGFPENARPQDFDLGQLVKLSTGTSISS